MYRYVCGESSKLTIGVNSKSSFLNFIVANISDDAGKLKSTDRQTQCQKWHYAYN